MKSVKQLCALSLFAVTLTASAQSTSDSPVIDNYQSNAEAACAAHPEQCANIKERLQADCAADPARCQAAQQRYQNALAAGQARCQQNPAACEQVRQNIERRQERRGARRERRWARQPNTGGGSTPSSGSAPN